MPKAKKNGIAACLPLFKPKIVPAKKGKKAYKRKMKHEDISVV